jgi:hypothetical protein
MARVELISSAYAGKSVIASGQECVNLYAEINEGDPQAPVKVTYYQTPGTSLFATPPLGANNARGCYRTSNGTAFYVVGPSVYFFNASQVLLLIGTIADRESQVYFADNGIVCVLVDGVNGYVVDLETNTIGIITDPNFYGADFVALLDTFFVFNRPLTNQFYISSSNASYGMMTNSAIETATIAAGAAYTNGSYTNVPLTGGSGSGATANITVAGAVVTVVTVVDPGIGYIVGDVLSATAASIGGTGAGFTYTVTATASAFDPLDIAAKSGFSDPIVGIVAVHGELWLIGALTTEIWIGTGAADFYFQRQQGAFIDHGCAAQYSIVTMDVLTFFIMQDKQGSGIVVQGQGYDVSEISTPRIVQEFKSYETLSDAIGFTFQLADHAFYCLVFPTASKGWIYDLKTKQWSEWNWLDVNGNLLRPRANCAMFVYGNNLVGDWENGKLLKLSPDLYMDESNPIVRIRTFPHLVSNNNKVSYTEFDADMQVGSIADLDTTPTVDLSWSDDKGATYGNPVSQSMGKIGQYSTVPSWNRLGMARDRVFKLSWSANTDTALNGAFIETKPAYA